MNYIGIDPSIKCTALVVNDKKFVYATSDLVETKSGKLTKWFELSSSLLNVRITDHTKTSKIHSDSEINKLKSYLKTANLILNDIKSNIDMNEPIKIGIEGYSYSSASGPLIDLVTLGTLIRNACITITQDVKVLQPSTVKIEAAKLAYTPIKKGKKEEWRNKNGIAGGSFKKRDMFNSLLDNINLTNDPWVEFLRLYSDELLKNKDIPKPFEDMNDAKIVYEVVKNI